MSNQTQTATPSSNGTHPPAPASTAVPAQTQEPGIGELIADRVKDWLRLNPKVVNANDGNGQPGTVGELALDADTPIAEIVAMLASATGDTEDVIRGIEDAKEHPAGQAITHLLLIAGYIAPPLLSVLIGIAIGILYSGGLNSVIGFAIFSVCVFYELGLVWLMFAVVKLAQRFAASGKGFVGLFFLSLFFLAVAFGSAAAQWAIYEGHVNLAEPSQVAGAVIRTFAVPLVDVICAVALPILQHVSLDKRLAEIEKKTEATIAINKKKIGARLALIQEAIITKSTLQKEKDYQAKNELANQLINLISEKILNDARSSLGNGGYGSRRDGYR